MRAAALAGDRRFKPHLFLPRLAALARRPEVLAAARAVLGGDVLLWSSDVNTRAPGDVRVYPHQDATYAGLSPADRVCTVWIALSDPVDATTGCLAFVRRRGTGGVAGLGGCGVDATRPPRPRRGSSAASRVLD